MVGDKKTPHKDYDNLNCIYLHPRHQEKKYKQLSDYIGWNKTERRTIGIVEAYNLGAEIVAVIDDDNIPYEHWGKNIAVGKEITCSVYENKYGVFDPLSVTSKKKLWHRGYPLQLLKTRFENKFLGKKKVTCLVQADLWNGEPDIDALCRWIVDYDPNKPFKPFKPFSCTGYSPFNSQNTFLHRTVLPYYMMLTGVGRVHDIWAAYYLEKKFPNSVVYQSPSVYQKRNPHLIEDDYIKEKDTYELTLDFIRGNVDKKLHKNIEQGFKLYRSVLKV